MKNPAPQKASIRSFSSPWRDLGDQIGQRFGDLIVGLRENARTGMCAQGVMTIAHPSGAQLGERVVYFRRGDRAALDVDQPMDVAPVITDDASSAWTVIRLR